MVREGARHRERERIEESKTIDFAGEEKNRERERERREQGDIVESLLCRPKGRDDLSSKIKRVVYSTRVYNETKGFLDGRGGTMRNG